MERRILLMLLALLIIFAFAACDEEKPTDNMDWIWVGTSSKHGALTDTGYYYLDPMKHVLSYVDLNSGTNVVLCNKVGCTHEGLECEAYITNYKSSPLFFWNDHVYYVDEIHTGALYRRDATGAKLMEIGTPAKKYIEEGKSRKIGSYVQAGEYLYYCAMISSSGRDETGASINLSESYCIGRIHLSSGKDEIIVEQATAKSRSDLQLYAAKANGVLFSISDGVDLSPGDPQYMDAYGQSAVTLNSWNESTGEITELARKTKNEFNEIQLVENGKVYYAAKSDAENNSRGDIYIYDLNNEEEEQICENATLYYYGGGVALRRTSEDENYLVYNLKTGEVLPMELFHRPLMYAYSVSGVVISTYILDEDNPSSIKETIYCYVTYESMADGLQESDLIPLYTVKSGYD